jgi:Cu-Zn family superoxide dismutase
MAGVSLLAVMVAVPAIGGSAVQAQGELTDLRSATDPTDGANGRATGVRRPGQTVVVLNVRDIDHAAAGRTFGAHVHIGPCVIANGGAALGHYNHGGGISSDTEVWLDFTVTVGGTGHATAVVPFDIPMDAAASIVVHELPTDPATGLAGARIACIGIDF